MHSGLLRPGRNSAVLDLLKVRLLGAAKMVHQLERNWVARPPSLTPYLVACCYHLESSQNESAASDERQYTSSPVELGLLSPTRLEITTVIKTSTANNCYPALHARVVDVVRFAS